MGKDPDLYDTFLPERWEVTPRVKLRTLSEVYHTVSKDDVHLVWKVSNVGSKSDMDPFRERERGDSRSDTTAPSRKSLSRCV